MITVPVALLLWLVGIALTAITGLFTFCGHMLIRINGRLGDISKTLALQEQRMDYIQNGKVLHT